MGERERGSVGERDRGREGEREGGRERERERGREGAREREREGGSERERGREGAREREGGRVRERGREGELWVSLPLSRLALSCLSLSLTLSLSLSRLSDPIHSSVVPWLTCRVCRKDITGAAHIQAFFAKPCMWQKRGIEKERDKRRQTPRVAPIHHLEEPVHNTLLNRQLTSR